VDWFEMLIGLKCSHSGSDPTCKALSKLMQMEPFLKAPACEQLGFVVMAAYVRDARPLGYTFCVGLHWSDLTLVYSLNHFVQRLLVAKACKLLGGPC